MVCVRLHGRVRVDLWGVHVDAERRRPRQRDTLSTRTRWAGVVAVLTLGSVEEGLLDLDAAVAVASVWPEFAAFGKDRLTVRSHLAHRAGLPRVRILLPEDAMYD